MANTQISKEIITRFFKLALKKYKTLYRMSMEHDISRAKLYKSYKDPDSNIFQLEWILQFHKKDKANIDYIFTGKGKRFL